MATGPVHTDPPPQAKLPGAKPYKATRNPEVLPVPYIPFPVERSREPDFAPAPPGRGYFLWSEVPRIKLRGLGPADSIILRHAIARNLFDPRVFYLGILIPWISPSGALGDTEPSRDLLQCPDAPLQGDGIYKPPYDWMAKRPPRPEEVPGEFAPPGGYPTYPGPLIIEIKPNAGYVAVGQVLCYHWAWMRHYGGDWPMQPAILTDLPRPYMPDFCRAVGVTLIALGSMLVEPPPWPT